MITSRPSIVITDKHPIPPVSGKTYTEPVNIIFATGSRELKMTQCIFEQPVHVMITGAATYALDFTGSEFCQPLQVIATEIERCSVTISYGVFHAGFVVESDGHLDLLGMGIQWDHEIILNDASFMTLFLDEMKFLTPSADHHFRATELLVSSYASFKKSQLGHANFSTSEFDHTVNFDRAVFLGGNFMDAQFGNDLYCNLTEFGAHALFNGALFKGQLVAPNLNEQSEACVADFSGSVFEKNVFLNFSRFQRFSCLRSSFRESASFNSSRFESAFFAETFFEQGANFSNTRYEQGDTETFQLIKIQLINAGNQIGALYYQAKELRLYDDTLKWRDHWREKILLWLNRYSTDYGVNWVRGVVFTFLVSVLFYTVYIISVPCKEFTWGWESWGSFVKASHYVVDNYFNFLALFRDFHLLHEKCPNMFSSAIDFVGRLLIVYGGYQTIQAFRKYGKA